MTALAKQINADPPENQIKSADVYSELNYGSGLAAYFLRASHALCELAFGPDVHFPEVLEVGAGGGHHISHVRHSFDRYVLSDLNADYLRHLSEKVAAGRTGKVEVNEQDATRLTYPDSGFDRVVATHVLEHLPAPHAVLKEWVRVLRPGGVLSLVLPTDPGLAWRVGRNFGPRAAAHKVGYAYDYWMAREHINPIGNLVSFVRYYFPHRTERWYPFPVPLTDINLFYICHIRV